MQSFQQVTPPLRLFHGPECLKQLGRELDRLGSRRAVIFCGRTLSGDARMMGRLIEAMGDRCAGVYPGVQAHSPAVAVIEAAGELGRLRADAVIAVGGGSAIVTARAASILLAEKGDLASLATSRDSTGRLVSPRLLAEKIPQVIVPTTPTTAMVKAGSAVLDTAAGERRALFDPKTRAQSIFVHPDFVVSAPPAMVLGSGLNTLAMAVEGLTSLSGNPLADAALMQAMRLSVQHLPNAAAPDPAVRGALVLAAVLCGQGTDATGAGMVTALGHIIGGRYHVENGIANAITLPHALRFNADRIGPGLEKIAAALGLETGSLAAVTKALDDLLQRLAIQHRLRDLPVPREALPEIADLAMADWFLRGNPRPIGTAAELMPVLEEMW